MANEPLSWGDALASGIEPEWAAPEHRAFDFWIGEWEMTWRGKQPDAFHFDKDGDVTRQRVFPILGGKAIVELAWARDATPEEASQRGFSIRYYDETRERWVMAQSWPGPGNDGSAFLDQLIGFRDFGRLSMYSAVRRSEEDGSYEYGNRRYNFADIRDGAFRWDGSNTIDEGKSWQTWNIVDASRIRTLDEFGLAGTAWPGYLGGQLCTDEPHGAYDVLEGNWSGTVRKEDGGSKPLTMHAGRFLDGCGVAMMVNIDGGRRIFSALGYMSSEQKWVMYTLDDQPGNGHRYFWSPEAGAGAVFLEAPALSIVNEFDLFVLDENFDEAGAPTRLVWRKVEPDEIVVEYQARSSDGGDWRTTGTYTLKRN